MDSDADSSSDYEVERQVKPDTIGVAPRNDESADILGNFDDAKRREIYGDLKETNGDTEGGNTSNPDAEDNEDEEVYDYPKRSKRNINPIDKESGNSEQAESSTTQLETETETEKPVNTELTEQQVTNLLRGASKSNRFVLYATNLNFDTTKQDLMDYFSQCGQVKSCRIPPNRRGGFAFVEMSDLIGFRKALELHNQQLHGRTIKIQISEGGKKKSANKKNILKQKNRKLSEMRNENKSFSKSGKNYDKSIKKEKQKEALLRKRWRKKRPIPAK